MNNNQEKTVMDLLEELKNDESFIPEKETREKFVFSLILTMIEV